VEHVTTVTVADGDDNPQLERAREGFASRYGRGEVRGSRADAERVFDWYVAARTRFAILEVRRHECRHDEGIGDCRDAVAVVG
jgi:hypothetical protein